MKNTNILYFVEGEDERKLVNVLKAELKLIKTGKVQVLNVVEEAITDAMLRPLKKDTAVVLVFDTDTKNVGILNYNILKLNECNAVSKVITIPQVANLEDELTRSCNIKKITDLLNSPSLTDFKRDFIRVNNLDAKLIEHKFDIKTFWSQKPPVPYQNIDNNSKEIKLSKDKI